MHFYLELELGAREFDAGGMTEDIGEIGRPQFDALFEYLESILQGSTRSEVFPQPNGVS